MNIDVNALLAGKGQPPALQKGQQPALFNDQAAAQFGVALEEMQTAQVLPRTEAELLLGALPADMAELIASRLPPEEASNKPDEEQPDEAVMQALVGQLPEGNPQWNLQQLVMRNSAVGEALKPVSDSDEVKASLAAALGAALPAKPQGENVPEMLRVVNTPDKSAPVTLVPLPTNLATATPEVSAAESNLAPPQAGMVALPAMMRPVNAPVALPVVSVPYPPHAPEWKQAVSQQIVTFSRNDIHNAEIRLHPEDLGSLQISIRVHQERAQVHIVSEHALVRQAMEQALPQLRAAMAESGLQLNQASVGADNPYGGFGAQGEGEANQQQAQPQDDDIAHEEDIVPTLLTSSPGNIYGINTFA